MKNPKEYRDELGGAPESVKMPWKKPSDLGYEIVKELGHGNQGVAKLARSKAGDEICIKVFRKEKMNENRIQDLVSEFNAMNMLQCERIAGTRALFQDDSFFYMTCDLYQGGDLRTLRIRAEMQSITTTPDWWRKIFKQCIEGLAFMHEQAIMHCDIKENNIMLKSTDFSEPEIIIIDLGICTSMVRKDDGIPQGTPGYVPPETLADLNWHPRGDVFSLGVTFFQVVCEMHPPSSGLFIDGCKTAREIFIATMEREPDWDRFPDDLHGLQKLLAIMLAKDRMKRPRAPQVLMDKWVTMVDADGSRARSGLAICKKDFYANVKPSNEMATVGITLDTLADMDTNQRSPSEK